MTFDEIKNTADKYLMPTYAHFDAVLKSGKVATIMDAQGRELIDFTAGIGVVSIGAGDEAWANAVANQAKALAHSSNLYYNEPNAMLAKALCERAGYEKVFFCNSGAEANECAIKLARKYSFDKYGENRFNIISLDNSFHGRTMATVTATGQDDFHKFFYPFNGGFKHASASDLDTLKELISSNDVCAVMIELIQGEGGVCPLDKAYVKSLAQICKDNDILLVVDEVQTGVGRTGSFFAFEHFGIKPDIITSAKGLGNGLPIGACLCKGFLGNTLTAGTHGTTFGGNPVICAGSLEVLKRIDSDLLTEVTKKGDYIRAKLADVEEIEEVRGLGLMIGIKLKTMDAKDVAKICVANGLLILTAKTLLRMLPPLTISYEEIDKGIEILKSALTPKGEQI
ncbi:MAG: aspartate aminotransferase family protein [Clostridia bacterium]|nr:aspartate aminotransferase family protein [Clostridia bacterium]